ncbi:MAG: ADP-ribosylglycohydrolase family protein [Archaeoglobus sp.]|uniref:ADP-ribosylglycohydrolase family protein n=1 Tax=Archaeoglobus sp. TaxID=1872626 RepID=UPI001DD1495A|nr:ADP-ribosylglycohydrolase family protein [Archaeoglobus sp.]MBO8181079.1 ADP-ribosylglycohydrolase family protein [Archaeoglobus sp.]
MEDRFRNCILGLAVGDALGMPVEGLSPENIKQLYGEVRDFLPSPYGDLKAGEWTDDTEQMIVLAESILETVYFSPENFAEKLKKWFVETSSRRIGPSSTRAISNLMRGVHWSRAGVFSDTCGAAMRVAPVGLVYHFSLNLVEKYAEISARVTHTGSAAIGGAVAVAIAISCNVLDFSDEEMLDEVLKRVEAYDNLLAEKIKFAYEISDRDVSYAVEKLGNSISALDVVPMAFYSYFSGKDFEESLIKAVNAGGDADSIAAVCGAIKGAKGFSIPERWLKKLKDRDFLEELAMKLYDLHMRIVKLT